VSAYDKLVFELSSPGRVGFSLPESDVPGRPMAELLPKKFLRGAAPALPEVSEFDVVRHYSRLSRMNYGLDTHFYPLGSCTMKYNPRINEDMARVPGFARLHPLTRPEDAQGALQLMYDLARMLAEIAGMDAVSLQPAAGAQGEFAGVLMIRAYHASRGEKRTKVLIPDSAHGTNPASTALAGYEVVEVKSLPNGEVDLDALAREVGPDVAAFMITVPNTLGMFEPRIMDITEICHAKGVQVYMDGANLNAILGITRPGDLGFDVCHFNLHKTFTTPHGGGGPGAGPVGVKAVLNANYIMKRLEPSYDVSVPGPCMHECVMSARRQKKQGVTATDIAKRLLDLGFYAPSTYFPLIVEEALMIEPTETESKETLDQFCDAMLQIAREAQENPTIATSAPVTTPVRRLDQTRAAREPNLRWTPRG